MKSKQIRKIQMIHPQINSRTWWKNPRMLHMKNLLQSFHFTTWQGLWWSSACMPFSEILLFWGRIIYQRRGLSFSAVITRTNFAMAVSFSLTVREMFDLWWLQNQCEDQCLNNLLKVESQFLSRGHKTMLRKETAIFTSKTTWRCKEMEQNSYLNSK